MAFLSGHFMSQSLARTVPFQAVIPTKTFQDIVNPGSKSYADSKPFRTLYLLHGIGGSDIDWLTGTRVGLDAENYGIAIIMPAGENGFYTDNTATNRYGEFVGQELVEATRAMFNLSHKKEDTAIGGLSMGGYGALRNGLKYADTFGSIMALSSALILEDIGKPGSVSFPPFNTEEYNRKVFGDVTKIAGSDLDVKALADKRAKDVDIYMACGTEDFLLPKNHDLRDYLQGIDANLTYTEGPGGHDWNFWDSYIEKAIKWFCEK